MLLELTKSDWRNQAMTELVLAVIRVYFLAAVHNGER